MYISLLLTIFCFASEVLSDNPFTPCKIGDQPCLNVLGNNLRPLLFSAKTDLGVKSSDPLFVETIEGDLSTFKYKLTNTTLVGYSNCLIKNLKINSDITKFQYDMDCPKLSASGKYDMSGQVVGLPVEGNGDFELTTGRYFVHFESDLEVTDYSDGTKRLAFTNFKLKCEPLTQMHFDFKNLYNGQKDLSDAFHKFVHENWHEVFVQEPIWNICIGEVVKNVNSFLKNVPLDNFIIF